MNPLLILTLVGSVYTCKDDFVPYQVALESRTHSCAGALIKNQWVISAAHCYSNQMKARLGYEKGIEQFINSAKVIIHPEYNSRNKNNDIMLVKLSAPASPNAHISTVSLPSTCVSAGTQCFVSGWDFTTEFSYPKLQCLQTPIQSEKQCKSSYPGMITKDMVCAAFQNGDTSNCQGYSGGPIVCNKVLHGIVSWGYECEKNKPGVYTKLCNYMDWVKKTIAAN